MEGPIITVVTPSFNQGKYIEATINSVLNQTYKNFEYIIVDGLSNDNTREILNKYNNNSKIKIIIEKDKGQSDAINKGFKLAKGEVVGWINSDDLLKLDTLESIASEYMKNKNASVFYGDIDVIDDDGNYIRTTKANNINYNWLLNVNPDITQQGSFYNTKYVRDVGYLDESIHFTMDYDLWLRLLKISDAVKINKVLGEFRVQPNSKTFTSGNGLKFWKDIFNVRKEKHKTKPITKLNMRFVGWVFKASINRIERKIKS